MRMFFWKIQQHQNMGFDIERDLSEERSWSFVSLRKHLRILLFDWHSFSSTGWLALVPFQEKKIHLVWKKEYVGLGRMLKEAYSIWTVERKENVIT